MSRPGTSGHDVVSDNGAGLFGVGLPQLSSLLHLLGDDRGFVSADRSPASLAAALREALADPAERGRRAERGRVFAHQSLRADVIAASYARTYAE